MKKGDGLEVTGTLALAGQSKSVTLHVERIGEAEMYGKRMGYSTTFTIKRSDFGMTYGIKENTLGDEVTLMVDLELLQTKK